MWLIFKSSYFQIIVFNKCISLQKNALYILTSQVSIIPHIYTPNFAILYIFLNYESTV